MSDFSKRVAEIIDAATGGRCNWNQFDGDIMDAVREADDEIDRLRAQNHRHHEHIITMGAHAGKVEAQLASALKTLSDIADPTLALLAETKAKMASDKLAELTDETRKS